MINVSRFEAMLDKSVEQIASATERLSLLIEYTAMMADVELPEEGDGGHGEE